MQFLFCLFYTLPLRKENSQVNCLLGKEPSGSYRELCGHTLDGICCRSQESEQMQLVQPKQMAGSEMNISVIRPVILKYEIHCEQASGSLFF